MVHAPPAELEERPGAVIACPPGLHIAFDAVDVHAAPAFHAAALAAGYTAFLFDPDGWQIEAAIYNTA